jgi:hypothetical protein
MGGVMSKRVLVAVVVLFAVAGCSGGGSVGGSAKSSASKAEDNPQAKECFVQVVKALNLMFGKVEGKTSGSKEEAEFAEFGSKASGTPTWDIYNQYMNMGVRDLAQGRKASSADAVAAYAPSVKLDCVQAYG